jgi:hypothetical protein
MPEMSYTTCLFPIATAAESAVDAVDKPLPSCPIGPPAGGKDDVLKSVNPDPCA